MSLEQKVGTVDVAPVMQLRTCVIKIITFMGGRQM